MRRSDAKGRMIKFHSKKNDQIMIVTSEEARSYCRYLEDDENVDEYQPDYPLDNNRLQIISHTDIRKEYFEKEWVSDFYIKKIGGVMAIRELFAPRNLYQLSEVEKIELSRRYWSSLGITDWRIVLTDILDEMNSEGE